MASDTMSSSFLSLVGDSTGVDVVTVVFTSVLGTNTVVAAAGMGASAIMYEVEAILSVA